MVSSEDNTKITVELNFPVAIESGTEFSIREGGKTVVRGKITKVY